MDETIALSGVLVVAELIVVVAVVVAVMEVLFAVVEVDDRCESLAATVGFRRAIT